MWANTVFLYKLFVFYYKHVYILLYTSLFLKEIRMGTTKIRKVVIKAVAAEELKTETDKELEKKDPENAREIIGVCGQNFEYSGPQI